MGRNRLAAITIGLFRDSKQAQRRYAGRFTGGTNEQVPRTSRNTSNKNSKTTSDWVPHPRSGIYFPKGQDWVMDDVPVDAASFQETYWLRTVDGVDKADPDILSADHYLHPHV